MSRPSKTRRAALRPNGKNIEIALQLLQLSLLLKKSLAVPDTATARVFGTRVKAVTPNT